MEAEKKVTAQISTNQFKVFAVNVLLFTTLVLV